MADENANAENKQQPESPAGEQNTNAPDGGKAVEGSQPQPTDGGSSGGGAEKRIRELSKKLKEEKARSERLQNFVSTNLQNQPAGNNPLPPRPSAYDDKAPAAYPQDEVDRAYRTLKDRGMVTKDELESYLTRMEWDRQHDRNEADVGRMKGLPAYDRSEVEEHARTKGISDPMAAYKDLYWDEMLDAAKRSGGSTKAAPVTEKPTKPSNTQKQPIDIEAFRKKLTGPDGRKFYEELAKDPRKFDEVMQSLAE